MKAILTFNLENRDERMEHLRCIKSLDMAIALFDIKNELYNDEINIELIKDILNDINLTELIE
jgi:hypothetical protein